VIYEDLVEHAENEEEDELPHFLKIARWWWRQGHASESRKENLIDDLLIPV
jgi:hypothetical protein